MNIAIVGAEAAKFTSLGEQRARRLILKLLVDAHNDSVKLGQLSYLVSGGCHLGGIDIWAEEQADHMSTEKIIHLPKVQAWAAGYKPRNLAIARDADELHNIVVDRYPTEFKGIRFSYCYHCRKAGRDAFTHVKSGGCWTMNEAEKLGKKVHLHVIENY
jgi:hypothetical protein